jgi:hypothetical protein
MFDAPEAQQLAVVRHGGRGVQDQQEHRDRDAWRETQARSRAATAKLIGFLKTATLAGRGPTSTSAPGSWNCANAWSS